MLPPKSSGSEYQLSPILVSNISVVKENITRPFDSLGTRLKISKEKLATVVEGYQKAPFSITTTLRCRGGCYSFPWIAPLYP